MDEARETDIIIMLGFFISKAARKRPDCTWKKPSGVRDLFSSEKCLPAGAPRKRSRADTSFQHRSHNKVADESCRLCETDYPY